ncbi:MAG: head GIN domain-containing protein [Bacteroidota bacterium]
MKCLQLILIATLATFLTFNTTAQVWEDGSSGDRETRNVDPFEQVSVGGGIDLIIKQGGSQLVEVEASSNVLEKLKTEVKNDRLKIYFDGRMKRYKNAMVYITVKNLTGIYASGGSDVESDGDLKFGELEINTSGGSDLELNLYCSVLKINTSGGSDAELTGNAVEMKLQASGGSDFDGYGFKVKKATVSASGGSDSNVYVTEDLTVSASGSSDVNYKGDPAKTELRSSGASDINGRSAN